MSHDSNKKWIDSVNRKQKILAVFSTLLFLTGALGFTVWFSMCYIHYIWIYQNLEDFEHYLFPNAKSILHYYFYDVIAGIIFSISTFSLFGLILFLSKEQGNIFRYTLLACCSIGVICSILGFIIYFKCQQKENDDSDNPPGCSSLEAIDAIFQLMTGEFKSNFQIYCSQSLSRCIAICFTILAAIVLGVINFFIIK